MEMSRLFQITTYKPFFSLFNNCHNSDEMNSSLNAFRFFDNSTKYVVHIIQFETFCGKYFQKLETNLCPILQF